MILHSRFDFPEAETVLISVAKPKLMDGLLSLTGIGSDNEFVVMMMVTMTVMTMFFNMKLC